MNFDTLNKNACVATPGQPSTGGGGGGPGGGTGIPPDPRCTDSAFAAANPTICGTAAYLILKPQSSIILKLGSVQFNVFLYQNGIENQLIDNMAFTCSDPTIFSIGASSGSGTGIAPGEVTITVTSNGLTASATLTVLDPAIGCSETIVASSICIDQSRSMSLSFAGTFFQDRIAGSQPVTTQTKLQYAMVAAQEWAGNIAQVNGQPKDSVKIWSFGDNAAQVTSGFSQSASALTTAINSVQQLLAKTDIGAMLTAAVNDLALVNATEKVIILISDGQQTDTESVTDILATAASFKASGGIIVCVGVRSYGTSFDLLDRIASGGFFINSVPATAVASLGGLTYIKAAVCAGACVSSGDSFQNTAELDYSSFLNWEVLSGQVDLIGNGLYDYLPNNGMYVALASSNRPATMRTIDSFAIQSGLDYTLAFNVAGNNRQNIAAAAQAVMVYVRDVNSAPTDPSLFQQVVNPNWNDGFNPYSLSFTAAYSAKVKVYVQQIVASGYSGTLFGNLLDNMALTEASTNSILFSDNFDSENPQYSPPACGPSAARAQTTNPTALGFAFIPFAGAGMQNGNQYSYAISYLTETGETGLSPVFDTSTVSTTPVANMASKVTMPVPADAAVIEKRLWRNDSSHGGTLFLLAVFPPNVPNYIDVETHTTFAARADGTIHAPASNTTSKPSGALGIGYSGCYSEPCQPSVALGEQFPDPSPLPDIETGTVAPTLFTSTKSFCAKCPAGQSALGDNLVPIMTSNTTPSGVASASSDNGGNAAYRAFFGSAVTAWIAAPASGFPAFIQYQFPTAQSIVVYSLTQFPAITTAAPTSFKLQGSNDGLAWTDLDAQADLIWFSGETKTFSAVIGSHSYFRLLITATDAGNHAPAVANFQLLGAGTASICETANASSYVSQSDADAKALAAATQSAQSQLNCITQYTSTQSYTATCATCFPSNPNALGSPVTRSANATSFISKSDADTIALASAKAAACGALDCTNSNNTQQITINDNAAATPFPSVQFITGKVGVVTKVTVNVIGFFHTSPKDVKILLVSPSGRQVLLMAHCGGANSVPPNPNVNPGLNFVFDDAAGSPLPTVSGTLVSGTFQCTRYLSIAQMEPLSPTPVPLLPPYGTALSDFIGDVPNGAWSLWVDDDSAADVGKITGGFAVNITSA